MLTSLHLLAGGGGDARGFSEAGFTPVAGANHEPVCVETLRANWPDADWRCADVDDMPMDNLPTTDVQVSSVICTELSPNGGNKRYRGQLTLDGHAENREAAFKRTRVTAYGVMRCAEIHRQKIVVVENVPEFVRDWHLLDWWFQGWRLLGYREPVIVCVDAAHVSGPDNPGSPSWRPRVAVAIVREDVPLPDLEMRPIGYCRACRKDVGARQVWKARGTRAGAYRKQFHYYCPKPGCWQRVEPYVRTAADAFDLADVGDRIRGREGRFKPSTMARLETAARYLGTGHAKRLSTPVQRTSIGGRYHCVIEWRAHCDCASIHEPLTTISAQGNHHGLVTAPDGWRPGDRLDVRDLHLRTITPAEQARAMRFPAEHTMVGTNTQQTSLAGNAVPVNLGRWLGERATAVLA